MDEPIPDNLLNSSMLRLRKPAGASIGRVHSILVMRKTDGYCSMSRGRMITGIKWKVN